jgi:hypothetical protein
MKASIQCKRENYAQDLANITVVIGGAGSRRTVFEEQAG